MSGCAPNAAELGRVTRLERHVVMLQRHAVQVRRFGAHKLPAAPGKKAAREVAGVDRQARMAVCGRPRQQRIVQHISRAIASLVRAHEQHVEMPIGLQGDKAERAVVI